jgi:restriction endonuclease S subunit/type I restriction-modification system DNA methylase subunit
MLNPKNYSCDICKTSPDQISHHKSHLETQKHKDKRELFEFKLLKLTDIALTEKYKTSNINDIIRETETIIYTPNNIKKKLIQIENNNFNEITNDMASLNNKRIEESKSVSSREALKDKIHKLHNFLRNNGAGYGMNALKVFNILFGLKKIEENNLLDKVNLSPECKFSYLLELSNENKDEELASIILGDVLTSISKSEIGDLLFYEIPQNIKGSVFAYLINEIHSITLIEKTCNVLLSGKIYEYFIGRDESAISELGAYFTDRHIVNYILNKLNPSINEDGTISTMIDMFGGSGGLTTGYINYLNEKYPGAIDWTTELNKISHFDMNEDVIKSAGLEFFCLTGILPDMKNNLKYKNSFTDDFENKKYKYPLTNPPYGGDKNEKSEAQNKREKIKEYIKNELPTITDQAQRISRQKQLKSIEAQDKQEKQDGDKTKVSVDTCSSRIRKFAKDNKLNGNDKESCSLMLLMDIVEFGGTAIGVLKEGVILNKNMKNIRKHLIENYNVREVISVPSDQFENTKTKTSIVIFDNIAEKTSEIIFSELIVERYTEDKFDEINGNIVIIENKGDMIGVCDRLVSQASREELLINNICSLNGKDYGKKKIMVSPDYELVTLADICQFLPKSKRHASFGQSTGAYNFYTSSDKVQKCDIADYTEECLIIGSGGIANIKIDDCFTCSADNLILTTLKPHYLYYLYYLFKGNMNLLSDGFSGSVLKHLSKDYLQKLQIPAPKSHLKVQEWVDKISVPYNAKNIKQAQIKELEILIQNRIREIEGNEACDEFELGSMSEIKSGKAINSENRKGNLYPYYAANGISGYVDDYLFDGEHIICAQDGSIGATHLVNGKFYSSNHVWVLKIQNNYTYYVYTILKNNIDYSKITSGSVIPKLTKEKISAIKIKIPKNKQFMKELDLIFQQIETLQNEVNLAEELYKQFIQELSLEAMPPQQHFTLIEQISTQVATELSEAIEIPKKKVKKIAPKKSKIIIEEEETNI